MVVNFLANYKKKYSFKVQFQKNMSGNINDYY